MGRWEDDMLIMDQAMDAWMNNDWDGTEELLLKGINNKAKPLKGEHDMRGAFAMTRAVITMVKGIATLADDQMKEAEAALKEADAVAAKDSSWAGKKVIRGVLVTMLGATQLAQKHFMKGLYNMLRAWSWISSLQTEGLEYEGVERNVVRSCSLLVVGSFNFVIGLMPPTLMKFTSFVSSFRGDRKGGLQMIHTCFEEQGIMAPFAGMFLIQFTTDTKTFLGESLKEEDYTGAKDIIDWFDEHYPKYVFYNYIKADYFGVKRDIKSARSQLETCAPEMEKFDGLHWLLNQKRALYSWVDTDWKAAAEYLRDAAQVYITAGRRSLVPFTTIWSMLSFLQAGMEKEAMEGAGIILERLNSSKKNWGRQDKVAFTLFKRHVDYSDQSALKIKTGFPRQWPLLDICEAQVQIFRTNYWMNEAQASNLVKELLTEESARETTADELVRMHWIIMDLYWHVGKTDKAWESYEAALKLESQQTKTKKGELYGSGYGVIPVMHVNAATIHFNNGNLAEAKASLAKVKPYNNKYTLNPLTQVKGTVMRKNLGLEFEGNFSSIKISSGKEKTVVATIPHELKSPKNEVVDIVSWYFDLQGQEIDYDARYIDMDGKETVINEVTTASSYLGELVLKDVKLPGTLRLNFNNSGSWLSSRTVQYRFAPVDLEVSEEA